MILNLADGSARNVTNNPAQDHQPTWSPDGQRLAFTSDRGGDFDIYVLDVTQGTAALLNDDEGWSMMPTWSPDGQLIAYLSSTTHGTELIVAAPDTGAQVYTSPIDSDSSFAWWP
jgi:TolB protein